MDDNKIIATLMKLLEISIVARSSRGCVIKESIDSEILDCSSFKSFSNCGDKEKKATSEPDTKADPNNSNNNIRTDTNKPSVNPSGFKNKKLNKLFKS